MPRLPKPGETLAASGGGHYLPGGKGANQAAAAARLGHATALIGQVGSDGAGELLRGALAEAGVELGLLSTTAAAPTGQAIILLQPGGENSIIIVAGANAAWSAPPLSALAALADCGCCLLLQREIPDSVNLAAARAAHAAGVTVVLDAGGADGPLDPELLACVSILSPNETELSRLVGLPTTERGGEPSEPLVLAAAAALQSQGVGTVLVKLGANGSMLVPPAPGAPLRQPALHAQSVVDTTGAGDCFTAAFAVALTEGLSSAEALRFASAAACICVQRLGAMPSLPSRGEVDALLASQPL